MDFIVDFILPVIAAFLLKLVIEYAVERIPIPKPRWGFDDQKERDKVNARKMVCFSPWLKTVIAILASIVAIGFLIAWLFPAVPMSMGFDPSITLGMLGIPLLFVLCGMMSMARCIYYNEKTFTYRNVFGVKKTYRYETIGAITVKKRTLTVIADGKRIVFPVTYYGAREFAVFASNRIHA